MEAPAKKKRNRQASSCEQCQKRRRRCDRGSPCQNCRSKSINCSYAEGTLPPVYSISQKEETEFLRQEVARLQAIIDGSSSTGFTSTSRQEMEMDHPPDHTLDQVEHDSSNGNDDPELASYDIVQAIGQLAIEHYLEGQETTADSNPTELVCEARMALQEQPRIDQQQSSSPVFPLTRSSVANTTPEAMRFLPSKEDELIAIENYFANVNWYCRPISRSQYESHSQHVYKCREVGIEAKPFSLAIVFAFVAIGMAGLSIRELIDDSRAVLVPRWLDLSAACLQLGKFIEQPNLDVIRVLLVLSNYYVALSEGNDASTGVAFVTLTVQSCLQLQLHRDPCKLSTKVFSPQEAEDRRRLYWFTYSADLQISSFTGRSFLLLHSRDTDTKLPADLNDEEIALGLHFPPFSRETEMTSLIARVKIAHIAEKICSEAFGIRPITYARIRAIDTELLELEAEIAKVFSYPVSLERERSHPVNSFYTYIIQLVICQERLRIHRPYLSRSYLDEEFKYSRIVCLETAKRALQIHSSILCKHRWAGVGYLSVCASIIIAVDILEDPLSPTAEEHRNLIKAALGRLERHSSRSNLCRRGVKVLQFLLQKDASAREDLERNFERYQTSDRIDDDALSFEESEFRTTNSSLQPQVEALLELRRKSVNFERSSPIPLLAQPDFLSFNSATSPDPRISLRVGLPPLQQSSDLSNLYQYPSQGQFQQSFDPPMPSSSGPANQPAYFPLPPIHGSENNYSTSYFSPPLDSNNLRFDHPSTISPELPPGFSAGSFDFNFPYDGTGLFPSNNGDGGYGYNNF